MAAFGQERAVDSPSNVETSMAFPRHANTCSERIMQMDDAGYAAAPLTFPKAIGPTFTRTKTIRGN